MSWQNVATFDLLPDTWAYSQPVEGTFFKVKLLTDDFEFRGKIAQVAVAGAEVSEVYNQELLRLRTTEEIVRLEKPLFLPARRIGIQAINPNRTPLEVWSCVVELSVFKGADIIQDASKRIEVSELTLSAGVETPVLSSDPLLKGHIIEVLGINNVLIRYCLTQEIELYSVNLSQGQKYAWDFAEIVPMFAFSPNGSQIKIYEVYNAIT